MTIEKRMVLSLALSVGTLSLVMAVPVASGTHTRPQAGAQFRVPLTISYKECTSPNRVHGGPLASPSCNPAVQSSNFLTVGTLDANGADANSVGFVHLKVVPRTCCPPQDVAVSTSISDVRCKPATNAAVCNSANATGGPDYTGELESNATIRITDHVNGPVGGTGGTDSATVRDLPFPLGYHCTNTPDASIGGFCTVNTSVLAMFAEMSRPPRAVVEISQIQVFDGGADGSVSTEPQDNTRFAVQGLFVP
jgi:hypothetical protein